MSDISSFNAAQNGHSWAVVIPDGAVSIEAAGPCVVLKASESLQAKFERLLEQRKQGPLSPGDEERYAAICQLDETLSWLNRLSRRSTQNQAAQMN